MSDEQKRPSIAEQRAALNEALDRLPYTDDGSGIGVITEPLDFMGEGKEKWPDLMPDKNRFKPPPPIEDFGPEFDPADLTDIDCLSACPGDRDYIWGILEIRQMCMDCISETTRARRGDVALKTFGEMSKLIKLLGSAVKALAKYRYPKPMKTQILRSSGIEVGLMEKHRRLRDPKPGSPDALMVESIRRCKGYLASLSSYLTHERGGVAWNLDHEGSRVYAKMHGLMMPEDEGKCLRKLEIAAIGADMAFRKIVDDFMSAGRKVVIVDDVVEEQKKPRRRKAKTVRRDVAASAPGRKYLTEGKEGDVSCNVVQDAGMGERVPSRRSPEKSVVLPMEERREQVPREETAMPASTVSMTANSR